MGSPPDPFALNFDSIDVDPTRAPSKDAIERALAFCAPAEDALLAPSAATPEMGGAMYSLIDDAGGRFAIDRDFGFVSLKDETLLQRERGAVYPVRMRVVEASGASYELDLKLRLTGRVPQVVGAEEFGFIADITAEATPDLPAAPPPRVTWSAFAAAAGAQTKATLPVSGPYGALFTVTLPRVAVSADLHIEAPPAPAPATAAWSI